MKDARTAAPAPPPHRGVLVCEDCGSTLAVDGQTTPADVMQAFTVECRVSFTCRSCLVRTDIDQDAWRAIDSHVGCLHRTSR